MVKISIHILKPSINEQIQLQEILNRLILNKQIKKRLAAIDIGTKGTDLGQSFFEESSEDV